MKKAIKVTYNKLYDFFYLLPLRLVMSIGYLVGLYLLRDKDLKWRSYYFKNFRIAAHRVRGDQTDV